MAACDPPLRSPFKEALAPHCWEYCQQAAYSCLLSLGTASASGNCSTEVRTPWWSCPCPMTYQCKIAEVVLCLPPGQLWRSFWSQSSQVVGQGCCWIWITTQFFLLSIPAAFPLFHKYWFLSTLLIKHPAGFAASSPESASLRAELRCPTSQFCLPTTAFLHRVSNEHRDRKHSDAGKYECEN